MTSSPTHPSLLFFWPSPTHPSLLFFRLALPTLPEPLPTLSEDFPTIPEAFPKMLSDQIRSQVNLRKIWSQSSP